MADHSLHLGARYMTFALAAIGAAFSIALLFVVATQQHLIEEKLKNFAISEVSSKAEDLLGAAGQSDNALLRGLTERLGQNLALSQKDIETTVRTIVQRRCGKDCPQVSGAALLDSFEIVNRIQNLRVGQKTVSQHLLDRYDATVAGLMTDLKTFGTANLVAFLTLIFLTIFKGQFGRKILPMTLLLTAYICAAIYWYVFGQDWASAILFNNWASGGYVTTMCIVYFLLFDFTFLNGRLTELIGNAVSSVFAIAPG